MTGTPSNDGGIGTKPCQFRATAAGTRWDGGVALHEDEIEVGLPLVRALVDRALPDLAGRPLRPLQASLSGRTMTCRNTTRDQLRARAVAALRRLGRTVLDHPLGVCNRVGEHGRSTEEEVREILRQAVRSDEGAPVRLGTAIAELFRDAGVDADLPEIRGHPVRAADFADE